MGEQLFNRFTWRPASTHAGVHHDVDERTMIDGLRDAIHVVGGRGADERQNPAAPNGQLNAFSLPAEEDVFNGSKNRDWRER